MTVLHLLRDWDRRRAQPDRGLWALGDPVYDGNDPRAVVGGRAPAATPSKPAGYRGRGRDDRFGRLPFSGREVTAARDALGRNDAEVLTGTEASEAAVKRASRESRLARFRYVHFATHGVLDFSSGRQPALVLALVGNGRDEDGFLTIEEVTGLRLNADVTVLSACQTGRGRFSPGEGVSGLARAFLYAGSRAVMCSQWQVDDAATADLMSLTYGRLKAGDSAAESLRQAQLALIREGRPPSVWAPFVVIGR
jgi:CHAT domain-containing protein